MVAAVPVRVALDLLDVPLAHLALLVALAWAGGRAPLGRGAALWVGCVAIGALRASDPLDAGRYGLHLLGPVVWLRAVAASGLTEVPRAWFAAALVPIGASLVALAAGQPADHVLHGWPRLIGAYQNLHAHASAMAVFAAAAWVSGRPDPLVRTTGVGATLALGFTYVRTGWLWVAGAVSLAYALRGRWWGVAAVIAALGALSLAAPERFADLGAVATGTPPAEGWGALGSWRGRIWGEALAAWWSGPAADVWLGRGLGGQYGLHRHLDVHSDWLALLVQLGPAGLLAWMGLTARQLASLDRADRVGAEAFALLFTGAALAAISNDWLLRATPILWTYGWVGIALNRAGGGSPSPPAA